MWRLKDGSPSIAGVICPYPAERPSTGDLLCPVVAAVKDHRLPDAKELERLVDVKVRPSVRILGMIQIGIAAVWAGVGIHAMRPRVLCFRREGVRELMLQAREQHIVVGFALATEGVNAVDK